MKNPSQKPTTQIHSNHYFTKPWNYEQLAEFLGMSPASLRVWVMQGRVPHYKIGKLVRFDPAIIKEWLQEQAVNAGGKK